MDRKTLESLKGLEIKPIESKESKVQKPTIKRRIGQRIKYTKPEQLQIVAEEYIDFCENEIINVKLAKTNVITGEALEIARPKPPLIETFCSFAGISYYMFTQFRDATKKMKGIPRDQAEKYEAIIEDIQEYSIAKIMEYMMLGWIDEGAAKFYITNNSRYQNQAKYTVAVEASDMPEWLKRVDQKKIDEDKDNNILQI